MLYNIYYISIEQFFCRIKLIISKSINDSEKIFLHNFQSKKYIFIVEIFFFFFVFFFNYKCVIQVPSIQTYRL